MKFQIITILPPIATRMAPKMRRAHTIMVERTVTATFMSFVCLLSAIYIKEGKSADNESVESV